MNDMPGETPQHPFKGTPFEHLFGAGGMPDLNQIMSQMQAMMAPHDGAVNWTLAGDLARRSVAQAKDPSPSQREVDQVADSVRLADLWLDEVCDFSTGVTSTAAWSRAEWVEQTLPVWRRLVEPVAEHVVGAMGQALPEEAKAMAGPLVGMLNQLGGAVFGSQ